MTTYPKCRQMLAWLNLALAGCHNDNDNDNDNLFI